MSVCLTQLSPKPLFMLSYLTVGLCESVTPCAASLMLPHINKKSRQSTEIKNLFYALKLLLYIYLSNQLQHSKKHWSSSPAFWLLSSLSDGRQPAGMNQTFTAAKFSPICCKTSASMNNWEVKQFFNLLSNLINYLQLNNLESRAESPSLR